MGGEADGWGGGGGEDEIDGQGVFDWSAEFVL